MATSDVICYECDWCGIRILTWDGILVGATDLPSGWRETEDQFGGEEHVCDECRKAAGLEPGRFDRTGAKREN